MSGVFDAGGFPGAGRACYENVVGLVAFVDRLDGFFDPVDFVLSANGVGVCRRMEFVFVVEDSGSAVAMSHTSFSPTSSNCARIF